MSLALEFLTDYLSRSETTQADFAKAAGIDPSLFTKLIQEEVGLNSKNVPKLLRGIHTEADRLEFLGKYLQEQIPADLIDGISIRFSRVAAGGILMEDPEEEPIDQQILQAALALPSDLYRRRLLKFLVHLRKDRSLRDLFTRTVAYLDEADHDLAGTPSYRSPVDPVIKREDRKRREAGKAAGAPSKDVSTERKPRPTVAPKPD